MEPRMQAPGGFLSPPPSSLASTAAAAAQALPLPRSSPLRPGGTKESAFIRYVDQQILHIQRRFAKRTSPNPVTTTAQLQHGEGPMKDADDRADGWDDVKGYRNMGEACKEVEDLLGVVWVSGTPSLQVPYLINLALLVSQVAGGMPAAGSGAKKLFRCLGKLDRCFASLLQGRDVETGEPLPGFAGVRGVSGTEKVRIRSLVERTRVGIMEAFKSAEFEDYEDDEDEEQRVTDFDGDDDDEMDVDGGLVLENPDDVDAEEDEDSWDMLIARVYDRTVQELGDSLAAPNIGVITEGRG